MATHYRLAISDYQGLASWSWSLFDSGGAFIMGHQVRLDTAAQEYEAIRDLQGHATKNGGTAREALLVAQVGDWLGERVLGPDFRSITGKHDVVVTVIIPDGAADLALIPLESARIDGRQLHSYHVTFVTIIPGDEATGPPSSVQDILRILALFPAPAGAPSLNQRYTREELERVLAPIAKGKQQKAVEFRALQYGVTSDVLRSALESDPGWDVVHICGYASPDLLRLPRSDPNDPDTEDIAELLDLIRGRLKLVTVSPCYPSASITRAAHEIPTEWMTNGFRRVTEFSKLLDCAVCAFRFPVPEDFAFKYFRKLYELLIISGRPLVTAAQWSLSHAMPAGTSPAARIATQLAPPLFGPTVPELRLTAPTGTARIHASSRVPPRFAGRDEEMRAASAALRMYSPNSGVLLYGVPGVGKSTCAKELTYTRDSLDPDNAFPSTIWYEVPSVPSADPGRALDEFAYDLENESGFPLSSALADTGTLRWSLAKLTEFLEQERYLIVLDNIDTLLASGGTWRDHRWGLVIGALTGHGGFSRVIMTSRRLPAVIDPRVLVVPLLPFRDDTMILIARRLGRLRRLLDGETPGISPDEGRRLGQRITRAVRGHPKLLEDANDAVGDPDRLRRFLAITDEIWADSSLFNDTLGWEERYVQIMERWTAAVLESLTCAERAFFHFVCQLTESDRNIQVISDNFPQVAESLCPGLAQVACDEIIETLHLRGLAMRESPGSGADVVLVHPVLAAYGRRELFPRRHAVSDAALVRYWGRAAASADPSALLRAVCYTCRLEADALRQVLQELAAADGSADLAEVVALLEQGTRPAYNPESGSGDAPQAAEEDS